MAGAIKATSARRGYVARARRCEVFDNVSLLYLGFSQMELPPNKPSLSTDIIIGSTFILALLCVVGIIGGPLFWWSHSSTITEIERFKSEGTLTDAVLFSKTDDNDLDYFESKRDQYISFYYHDPSLPGADTSSKYNAYAKKVGIYRGIWNDFNIVKDELFKVYIIHDDDGTIDFLLEEMTIEENIPGISADACGKPVTIGSIIYLILFAIFIKIWRREKSNKVRYQRQDYSDMV